jgi:hypothetical protein
MDTDLTIFTVSDARRRLANLCNLATNVAAEAKMAARRLEGATPSEDLTCAAIFANRITLQGQCDLGDLLLDLRQVGSRLHPIFQDILAGHLRAARIAGGGR